MLTSAAEPMPPLLEARGLKAAYGPSTVLHGIDFAIDEGEVCCLLGANGAGKTTTLRAICGMVRTEGEIRFCGERIDGRATEDIVRRRIAHVPDGRGTFMELTVEENLRLGAYLRPSAEIPAALAEVYEYFPKLRQRLRQQAGTLSGGEQQMLAIARALLLKPRLLLLDEPSFGLAPVVVEEVFALLERIKQDQRLSIFLVEQNANLALALSDRAYLLETGRVVMEGPASELAKNEAIRRAYLGF